MILRPAALRHSDPGWRNDRTMWADAPWITQLAAALPGQCHERIQRNLDRMSD